MVAASADKGYCMTKFIVSGVATISCWTRVEADSAEQAIEIAGEREIASLSHNAFADDSGEFFHCDTDGTPKQLKAEEE